MADEQRGQNVDISSTKPISTQTPQELEAAAAKAKLDAEGDQGTGTQGEGTAEGGDGQDDVNPDTKQPYTAAEWKKKFSDSSRGAQDLLTKNQTLEIDIAKVRADSDKTLKEKDDEIAKLRAVAEGKNPEGLSLLELQKQLGDVTTKLTLSEENTALNGFLSATKIAGAETFKESLRALARANPSVPIATLWDQNFKAGAEAAAKVAADRSNTQHGSASDSGRGSSSREHKGETVGKTGLTLEEFNALPVAKRKELYSQGKA